MYSSGYMIQENYVCDVLQMETSTSSTEKKVNGLKVSTADYKQHFCSMQSVEFLTIRDAAYHAAPAVA